MAFNPEIFYKQLNETTIILISLSLILLAGFLMTRLTKPAKLPNVTGYIIAGILIGPHVLNLIPIQIIKNMTFISDVALAFIAFGVGKFFKKDVISGTGWSVIVITLFESLLAGAAVSLFLYRIFDLSLRFSLLLGAIATATAPASTMVTIRQYNAKGYFVNTLLQVVALDDAVCLIAFSIVTAILSSDSESGISMEKVSVPVLYNIATLALAYILGNILSRLVTPRRSEDNRLILTVAFLLGLAGFCAALNISPLLSCMLFGACYINMTKDDVLYSQVEKFSPPILSLFFVVSGMNLNLGSFSNLGLIGISYFVIRILGKYLGAFIGSWVTGAEATTRNYLGLALIPQAGVAIGLAFLGQRMLFPDLGDMLLTIILSSSVLYELVGPVAAKVALFYTGSLNGHCNSTL